MADMPTDVPTGSYPWIIGSLIAALIALAGVVAHLFKLMNKRIDANEAARKADDTAHATERTKWTEERVTERMRWAAEKDKWESERELERATEHAEYERKHREIVEHYEETARADRVAHYQREEQQRKDHAEMIERVSEKASQSAASMVTLLQKIHDRFLGGGKRRGG